MFLPKKRNFNFFIVLTLVSILLSSFSIVKGADVLFEWDPNTESELAGYEIFHGSSSGTYHSSEKLGNVTEYTMSGLEDGVKHYFALKAYDINDNKSEFSDEIGLDIPDLTQPSIISVQSAGDATKVFVTFSEPVENISATNISNYTIDNGITIWKASIDADSLIVTLDTTPHSKEITYTLKASNIQDIAISPNVIDPTLVTYTYTSLVVVDDFSVDTIGNYTVTNTDTRGGTGSLIYDSNGKRAQMLTEDNVGLYISNDMLSSSKGSFSLDFLPTVEHPKGGTFILRLVQDVNNYYELKNTDGYGAGQLTKYVDGIDVESGRFINEYVQNNNYAVTLDFSPEQTTANAFGESISINTNSSDIKVKRFEIEVIQQDAFLDNIKCVVNNAPVSIDDTADTFQNTPVDIVVIGNDADIDGTISLNSVAIVETPVNGIAVSNPNGTVTYTPNAGYIGEDSFKYTVADDLGAKSNIATVTIIVKASNQAPDGVIITPAGGDTITAGDSVDFEGIGTDPDGDTLLQYNWSFGDPSIADATSAAPGLVTFNNEGVFTVTLTVTDSGKLSDSTPATVQITVKEKPNQAPNGVIDTPNSDITITEGDSVNFKGTGTDPDKNTPLGYSWSFGDPSISDSTSAAPGLITFNNKGVFTVTFTVTDAKKLSDSTPATVQITVEEKPNQAPDGVIDTPNGDIIIKAGDSVNFEGTGTDPDKNTPLEYSWSFGDPSIPDSTLAAPGLITFNNEGVFNVALTVTDSENLSDTTPATLTVRVEARDVDFFDEFSVDTTKEYEVEDVRTNKGLKGSFTYDSDGKRAQVLSGDNVILRISHDLPPLNNGQFAIDFLPTKIYPKGGTFSLILRQDAGSYYRLTHTDGYGPGSLDKYIGGKKVDSVSFANKYFQNNNYNILINFGQESTTVDAFGESISISSDVNSIKVNRFELEIGQQDAFFDNISYISDVVANKQPVAQDDNAVTSKDTFVDIKVIANDNDVDGNIEADSVDIIDNPVNGETLVNFDGSVNYMPNLGFTGDDTFTYTVRDNLGKVSNIATVNITVKPDNQEPNGVIETPVSDQTISVGDSINFAGVGTDIDNNTPLTYLWNFGDPVIPESSTDVPGIVTFSTPGVYTVTFTVTDSMGLSDATPATLTVTVKSGMTYFSDDFSRDTTGDYTVDDTDTRGGTGSFMFNISEQKGQVRTGDNVGMIISQNLQSLESGMFNMDFLPTVMYPKGGVFKLRLVQDVNNYYELLNTDGYGAGQLIKYVNGVKVDSVPFSGEFSQEKNYSVTINFSPALTTVDAFGESISIKTDNNTIMVSSFEVELMQQDAFLDNIVYLDSGINDKPSTKMVDDFSVDTTGSYTVTDGRTTGGFGSFEYDASGERVQMITGDNIGLKISQDLDSAERGSFSIDFLPAVMHPKGGIFTLRLIEDENNYYALSNTDGYGARELKKFVNGVEVDSVPLAMEYSQKNEYTISIDFSPEQTTANAFGETITMNADNSSITVNSFAVEVEQQDAFLDNIEYR